MAYGIGNIEFLITREDYTPPAPEEPPPDPEPPPPDRLFTTQTPANTNNNDTSYCLGTTFRSDVDGQVVGITVFAADELPTNTAPGPEGTLWRRDSDSTGTLLASKPFGTLTPGTWCDVLFDTPVDIIAGQMYKASWGPTNRYVSSALFFDAADVVNGHLTGVRNVLGVSNGVFVQASVVLHPSETFNASCYFVGPLFRPAAGP